MMELIDDLLLTYWWKLLPGSGTVLQCILQGEEVNFGTSKRTKLPCL